MKKRAAARPASKANAFPSPLSIPSLDSSASKPVKPYDFDLNFVGFSSRKTISPVPFLRSPCPPSPPKSLAAVSDLKNLASSGIGSLKRRLGLCNSEILKELDAADTRISKRFKIQAQAYQQLTEEAEKDYKKIIDRISEEKELVKASYAELITEAQATASRVCKVSIPELAQSMEKAVEGLRSRYRIPATPL